LKEDDKIAPKYLNFSRVPGVCDKDTIGNKI